MFITECLSVSVLILVYVLSYHIFFLLNSITFFYVDFLFNLRNLVMFYETLSVPFFFFFFVFKALCANKTKSLSVLSLQFMGKTKCQRKAEDVVFNLYHG